MVLGRDHVSGRENRARTGMCRELLAATPLYPGGIADNHDIVTGNHQRKQFRTLGHKPGSITRLTSTLDGLALPRRNLDPPPLGYPPGQVDGGQHAAKPDPQAGLYVQRVKVNRDDVRFAADEERGYHRTDEVDQHRAAERGHLVLAVPEPGEYRHHRTGQPEREGQDGPAEPDHDDRDALQQVPAGQLPDAVQRRARPRSLSFLARGRARWHHRVQVTRPGRRAGGRGPRGGGAGDRGGGGRGGREYGAGELGAGGGRPG